jgi:hemoglobin
MPAKQPITSYQDIQSIVDEHYRQLLQDPYTSPKFQHVNMPDHMPRIYHFWSFILNIKAEEHPYKGSAFEPHARLNLEHGHFETWLKYLFNALDQNYEGEVVETWKEKARQMGMLFEYKLGLLKG